MSERTNEAAFESVIDPHRLQHGFALIATVATEHTVTLLEEGRAALIAAAVRGQIDAAQFRSLVEFSAVEKSC